MKKIVIVLMVAFLLYGCSTKEITTKDTSQQAIPVKTVKVHSKNINDYLELAGQAMPSVAIPLMAPNPLEVKQVNVSVGDKVNKGDVLIVLDNQLAKENVIQMEKAVNQLESAVADTKKAMDASKKNAEQLKALQADLDQSLENSQGMLSNIKTEELESLDVLKQSLELAIKQAQLSQAASKMPQVGSSSVIQLENQLAESKLKLKQARESLKATTVVAPISGTISQMNVEENGTAVPGSPLGMVVQMDPVVAAFQVNSFEISKINEGMEIEISFGGMDAIYKSKITSVPPTTTQQTSTYLIEIPVENKELKIKGGMKANGIVSIDTINNAKIVPEESVLYEDEQAFVFVNENGTAVKKKIETGVHSGADIQVTSGLSLNDQVVTQGKDRLSDNAKISVKE
ncbi:efflux RND transporter periplasmic adaptor subunit [Pseudalkalibacillus caeni]|uniref:Efflux RND transporter periplasmic adaptor subunit n=1 Tax=Exobacillus caeni TaxID=2574798 RepID=A0A5R9FDU9_9BACL|nr:efflux RND transporter periplasmic adaptor subunit [Pseudalkalibacillus caeni]TLS37805.1 efflux RND transporter periplasmic adaptor subunit [Pseudalkalibacillus caeni]